MLPAYLIVNVEIRDAEKYNEYRRQVPATLAKFEASYLVRGGEFETVEGELPYDRVVVLRFPSWDQARAWYNSREYAAVKPLRLTASRGNLYLMEGNAPAEDLGEAPGFFLAQFTIRDEEAMAAYYPLVGDSLAAGGGKVLAAGKRVERLEGDAPSPKCVLLAFESYEAAKAWYNAPHYEEALKIRLDACEGSAVIVEGL